MAKHSGQDKPPMYGDYEAQRHWQEITRHLPATEWYVHNPQLNNLSYWGLDYPPLTAFHSLAISYFAKPEWVALKSSHGMQTQAHKVFMRASVLFSDLFIYIPAAIFYARYASKYSRATLVVLLNAPFLLMVDYGHFQYNGVTIGLVLAALCYFVHRRELENLPALLGASLFMASIMYKQMALYYSLPVFFFLIGKVLLRLRSDDGTVAAFWLLCCLATGVIIACGLSLLPWLLPQEISLRALKYTHHQIILDRLTEISSRVFPVGRGIFEDKVASFWCTLNNVFKVKELYSQPLLFKIAMLITMGFALPTCLHMLWALVYKPRVNQRQLLRYCIINVGLAFFLFSYHVHEKTILLVGIPVLMDSGSDLIEFLPFWFSDAAMFSLVPLFIREGSLHYACGAQLVFVGVRRMLFTSQATNQSTVTMLLRYLKTLSEFVMLAICTVMVFYPSPSKRYPDLMPVLVAAISSCLYGLFLTVFLLLQINLPLDPISRSPKKISPKKKNS